MLSVPNLSPPPFDQPHVKHSTLPETSTSTVCMWLSQRPLGIQVSSKRQAQIPLIEWRYALATEWVHGLGSLGLLGDAEEGGGQEVAVGRRDAQVGVQGLHSQHTPTQHPLSARRSLAPNEHAA